MVSENSQIAAAAVYAELVRRSSLLYGARIARRPLWPSNRLDSRPKATVTQIWINAADKETVVATLSQLPTVAAVELIDILPEQYSFELTATVPGRPQPMPNAEQLFQLAAQALLAAGVDYCRPPASSPLAASSP